MFGIKKPTKNKFYSLTPIRNLKARIALCKANNTKYFVAEDWKNTLKKYPDSDINKNILNIINDPEGICLKLKKLKECNRQLRLKNMILRNRVIQLEDYTSFFIVFIFEILGNRRNAEYQESKIKGEEKNYRRNT